MNEVFNRLRSALSSLGYNNKPSGDKLLVNKNKINLPKSSNKLDFQVTSSTINIKEKYKFNMGRETFL